MSLEQYSKATKETAENLRIIDDAMFRLVVERKGVCQEILRTLLDKPQLRVVQVTSQSVMTSLHREITLDALCILENDEYVNIEMQKGSGNDDIRRTRFHAAATTAAYTPKGTDFSDIPYVTVLYITEYDALQTGQAITYVKRCMKTKEGFVKFSNLSKAVKYFKETEGGFGEMCKTVEDYARECEKIGRSEGRSEERVNAIRKMLKNGFTREVILSLDYSEAELEDAEKNF